MSLEKSGGKLQSGIVLANLLNIYCRVPSILPYVGYISILMVSKHLLRAIVFSSKSFQTETPQVKYAIFCILALTSLL